MRGSVAKSLRRQAQQITVGKPDRKYAVVRGTVVLHPQCTRAQYKRMKRWWVR